jgi:hypothetical protein
MGGRDATSRAASHPRGRVRGSAFLWELVHSFDLLFQYVNQDLGLGLAEDDVSSGKVDKATKQQKSSLELNALRSIDGVPWFEEMKEYRNFAHRGQLMLYVDVAESGVNGAKLEPVAPGALQLNDVPKQLLAYLTATQTFMSGLGFWP